MTVVQRWIEAGKVLAVTPEASVLCPVCQHVSLKVKDVRGSINESIVERWLTCPSCGASNSLRLNRPLSE